MLAIIRVIENGTGRYLCDLDLMKFSEEQVRERMRERGIGDDAFFICGFRDWDIDRILSLEEAYNLKRCIESIYDGDDYLVRFMLSENRPLHDIFGVYYKFFSKDEFEVIKKICEKSEPVLLLDKFQKAVSWPAFVMSYHHAGHIVATPKGYYLAGRYFS